MKRVLAVMALGLVGATATQGAQTPALPTVDQILEKHITAVGGRQAIEKVTSVSARGTIQVVEAGISGTIELLQKAPDKSHAKVEIAGTQQREGVDGVVAWSEDPQNGLREKTGVELAEAKRTATFHSELKMKSLYPTMTVRGRESIEGREAYVVEAVPEAGSPQRLFFDVDTGLMVRQIATRQTPQGPIEIDVTIGDFRVIDGVKHAFSIRQKMANFSIVIQLSDVTHNVPIDDATFRKPGK